MCLVAVTLLYTPLIEFPMELFYGGDVGHDTYVFTIPGETRTSYDFYLLDDSGTRTSLSSFFMFFILWLFYTVVFLLIGFARRAIWPKKKITADHNVLKNQPQEKRALFVEKLNRWNSKKVMVHQPLFFIVCVIIFFLMGRAGWFGII